VAWWLPLTCLGFLSSGFLYFHQALGFFPPLALGTGLALVWIHDRLLPRLQVRTALVLTLAFLLWIEPLALYQALIVTHLRRDYPLELTYPQALGPWLDRHLPPGATFYVVGVEVPLYLYSGRRAASRYPYGGWTSRQVHETILRDFDAEPPAALIFSTPLNFPPLNDLGAMIRAWPGFVGYQRVPQPVPGGYELYLRQDLAAGIAP
jgi:hypothetical protein